MTESTKKIKDFIYVDQARLYSFYSQLNKGVAQQIFQSVVHGEAATSTQANPEVKDETIESERNRSLQTTENTILYDYMYEQLEAQLSESILDVSTILANKNVDDLTTQDIQLFFDSITNALMVKVTGNAEFEDYGSMDAFVANANKLMKAFAHFMTLTPENVAKVNELKQGLESEGNVKKKNQIREEIKKLQSADAIANDNQLLGDAKLIENLRVLLEVLYGDSFHIAITTTYPPFAAFRGIVNRDWLRIKPGILRSLYPGLIESPWTMVGQVTSKSLQSLDTLQELNALFDKQLASAKSMRDAMRYIFNRVRSLEGFLNQGGIRFEPVVFPLAIYRELTLPIPSVIKKEP
jgi:hypothetical protein